MTSIPMIWKAMDGPSSFSTVEWYVCHRCGAVAATVRRQSFCMSPQMASVSWPSEAICSRTVCTDRFEATSSVSSSYLMKPSLLPVAPHVRLWSDARKRAYGWSTGVYRLRAWRVHVCACASRSLSPPTPAKPPSLPLLLRPRSGLVYQHTAIGCRLCTPLLSE